MKHVLGVNWLTAMLLSPLRLVRVDSSRPGSQQAAILTLSSLIRNKLRC